MASRLQKKPRITVIPGKQGVPGIEGGCRVEREITGYQTVKETTDLNGQGIQLIWFPGNPLTGDPPGWITYPAPVRPVTLHTTRKVPIYKDRQVCWPSTPPIPAVPARIVKNASSSWEDGARSVAKIGLNQYIELDVRLNPVAIMVGLSEKVTGYSYGRMEHAAVIRPEGIYEVISGRDEPVQPLPVSKIKIAREGTRVSYYANGIKIAETSVSKDRELYAYVLLYAASDYVENPKVGNIVGGSADLLIQSFIDPTPRGISVFDIQTNAIVLAMGKLLVSGLAQFAIRSSARSLALARVAGTSAFKITSEAPKYVGFGVDKRGDKEGVAFGDISYAVGALGTSGATSISECAKARGVFPPIKLSAYMGRAEAQTVSADGLFPAPEVHAWALNGGVMSGESGMTAKGKASESDYLGGTVEYLMTPVVGGWFDEMAKGVISAHDSAAIQDYLSLDSAVLFSFIEGMEVGSALDIYLIIDLAFNELVMADDGISFNALLELIISEQVQISPNISVARQEALQYAVNAVTGALSRYSNFGFKQFSTTMGKTYAITSDGLYELAGSTDSESAVSASIDFGASDYGKAQSKRMSSVYAGIATDGGVYFRVAGDQGTEAIYKAIDYGAESRAHTAKGLVARHWRIRLDLVDASYADLDNIEVEIGVSQRRLAR